jgi:hypothetical protein
MNFHQVQLPQEDIAQRLRFLILKQQVASIVVDDGTAGLAKKRTSSRPAPRIVSELDKNNRQREAHPGQYRYPSQILPSSTLAIVPFRHFRRSFFVAPSCRRSVSGSLPEHPHP